MSFFRSCELHYVPDWVKKKEVKEEMELTKQELIETTEALEQKLAECQEKKSKIELKREMALEEIRKFRYRVTELIDGMAKKALDEIEFRFENAENAMEDHAYRSQPYVNIIEEKLGEARALVHSGVAPDDPRVEELMNQIQTAKSEISNIGECPQFAMEFQPNRQILELLQDQPNLGTFKIPPALAARLERIEIEESDKKETEAAETNVVRVPEENRKDGSDSDDNKEVEDVIGERSTAQGLLAKLKKAHAEIEKINEVLDAVPEFQPQQRLLDLLAAGPTMQFGTLQPIDPARLQDTDHDSDVNEDNNDFEDNVINPQVQALDENNVDDSTKDDTYSEGNLNNNRDVADTCKAENTLQNLRKVEYEPDID